MGAYRETRMWSMQQKWWSRGHSACWKLESAQMRVDSSRSGSVGISRVEKAGG